MTTEQASCYCGNVSAKVTLTKDLPSYVPRACDCEFCIKNGAAYISDKNGKLEITIEKSGDTTLYQQGDKLVELLICKSCGVLVSVMYLHNGTLIGGVNSKTLANRDQLAPAQVSSPKLLSSSEKIDRWSEIWFPDVVIERQDA